MQSPNALEYKPKQAKTSISHPINISWIIPSEIQAYLSNYRLPDGCDLYDCIRGRFRGVPDGYNVSPMKGNLCLSSCPGKKVRLAGPVKGRATINRDLDLDFARMQLFGITMVVCCLDDIEMEYLGAPWPKYAQSATEKGIQTYRIPMEEGGCPTTLEEIQRAIDLVNLEIIKGNNVLVHCRGGVGRAGLFACCWLLENMLCTTAQRAISVVREQRSPKAIETLRQADYIIQYSKFVKQRYGLTCMNLIAKPTPVLLENEYSTPSIHAIAKLEYDIMTA